MFTYSILVSFDFVPSICRSNNKNYYKIVLRKCSTSVLIDKACNEIVSISRGRISDSLYLNVFFYT